MPLKTSSTGSFPPLYDPNLTIRSWPKEGQEEIIRKSIERAIKTQIDLDIDILVDGQPRDDIVSIFCRSMPGFSGASLPYRVVDRIRPPEQPITLSDFMTAKKLANGRPLKAHITGPMTIARDSVVDPRSGYTGKTDPNLIRDIARALGEEARYLVKAGAEIVQIDEPVLADRVDLEIAFDAMRWIIEVAEVPFPALHACGNISMILEDILARSPVKMVSIEGSWLRHPELDNINSSYLAKSGKKIGLGCIAVADYSLEKLRSVQSFLDHMVTRLGADNIWAVMPNCGLRPMPYDIAIEKLKVMVKAAKSL